MGASANENSMPESSEICTLLRSGWPNSISQFLYFLPGLVMLKFLGTDPDDLAAAGMGFMFVNVTGQSFIMGSGIGSVTLISQAFGAQNYLRCGDILQRQLAIHAVLVVFIFVVWLRSEEIFLALGQPAVVAARSAQFVRWRLGGLPCIAIRRDFQCYLLAQRVMQFPMVVGILTNLLNVGGFILFIPRLGFIGAPVATTLADAIQAIIYFTCSRCFIPERDAWPKWNIRNAFAGWKEILMLGLPAGALQLGEWWAWEMNLFFAGRFCSGKDACIELDVFPILSSTMVILFTFHVGFSLAAGALVGNALGAGDPDKARRISQQNMFLVSSIAAILALSLYMLRNDWGRLFVSNEEVVGGIANILPLVALYVFVDSVGPGALVNILRNAGVVCLPAVITYVAFYMIGIPFGLSLAFRLSWGLAGLWIGLVTGLSVQVLCLLCFVCCYMDWQSLADEAQNRSRVVSNQPSKISVEAKYESIVAESIFDNVLSEDAFRVDVAWSMYDNSKSVAPHDAQETIGKSVSARSSEAQFRKTVRIY